MGSVTTNLVTRLTVEGAAEIVRSAQASGEGWASAGRVSEAALNRVAEKAGGIEALYERLAAASKRAAEADQQRAEALRRNDNISFAAGVRDPHVWDGTAQQSASVFESFERQQQAAEALRRQMDPLYAAQTRYNDEVAAARALMESGALAEDAYRARVDQLTTSLNVQKAALAQNERALQAQIEAVRAGAATPSPSPLQGQIDRSVGVRGSGLSDADRRNYENDMLRLFQEQEAAQLKLKESAEALRRQMDPLYAAQAKFDEEMARAVEMHRAGALSTAEYGQRVDQLTISLNVQRAALEQNERALQAQINAIRAGDATPRPLQDHINSVTGQGAGPMNDNQRRAYEAEYIRLLQEQDRAIHALKVQLDPLGAAQDRLNAAIAHLNTLRPHITVDMYEAALKRAHAEFDAFERSQRSNRGTQLSTMQLAQLSYQLNDVATGLMSGQSLFMIFAQQAGQIYQVLEMGPQGVAGSLKALMALFGPVEIAFAALAAVAAVAAIATLGFSNSQNKLELSLMGVGAASGQTADQLQHLAEVQGDQGNIAVAAARNQENAYLRMGITNSDVFGRMIAISRNYSIVAGVDLKNAAQSLGKAMAEPSTAGLELLRSLGLLDAKTKEYILTLERQGDHEVAQEIILGKVSARVQTATEHVNVLAEAWHNVATWASNAFDSMGKYVDAQLRGPSPQEVIDHYKPRDFAGYQRFGGVVLTEDVYKQALVDRESQNADAAIKKKDGEFNRLSLAGDTAARSLDPTGFRRRELDALYKAAQTSHGTVGGNGRPLMSDEEFARVEAGYKRQIAAIDKQENPTAPGAAKAARLQRDIDATRVNTAEAWKLADAYLVSESSAFKAEAARKALTEATKRGIDADAAVQRQLNLATAEVAANSAKTVLTMRQRTQAQADINTAMAAGVISSRQAGEFLQLEAERRPIAAAMAVAEGTDKAKLKTIYDALTQAYIDNIRVRSIAFALGRQEDSGRELASLQKQLDLVRSTNEARSVEMAQFRAMAELKDNGIDLSKPESLSPEQLIAGTKAVADAVHTARAGVTLDQAQYLEDLRKDHVEQLALLRLDGEMAGRPAVERQREINLLKARQELLRRGIAAESEEGRQVLANVALYEKLAASVERRKSFFEGLTRAGESAFDRLGDLVAQGETGWRKYRDAALDALGDIMSEAIRMAALNPLKNWLFGTNLPTMKDSGGSLADLFTSMVPGLFGTGNSRAHAAETAGEHSSRNSGHLPSFEGGGFTGRGARSGGLDGRGGFLAMLHPDEGVTDYTRPVRAGMRAARVAQNRAPVIVSAPSLRFDLGSAVGPIVDFMNGVEGLINDRMVEATDLAVARSRRGLESDLDSLSILGT